MADIPTFTVTGTAQSPPNNPGPSIDARLNASIRRWQQAKDSIFQDLRVGIPAVVTKFTSWPTATVCVQIAINDVVQASTNGPNLPVNIAVKSDAPGKILQDVPVAFFTGGGWNLTFPIAVGDECMLLFADACLDSWFQSGGVNNNPLTGWRHNLADAVAIFGLRSKPRGLPNYSTTSAQLRSDDGTVVIDLASGQITITAPTVVVNSTTATVNASGTATVSGNNVDVTATDTVTVAGNTININAGNVVSIGGTTSITLATKNWLTHTHTVHGVQLGAGSVITTGVD